MALPAFDIARPIAHDIAHALTDHKGVGVVAPAGFAFITYRGQRVTYRGQPQYVRIVE